MATDTEKELLKIAKDVYAHFTRDSLPIAKQIIEMEDRILGSPRAAASQKPFVPTRADAGEKPPAGKNLDFWPGAGQDDEPLPVTSTSRSAIPPNTAFEKGGKNSPVVEDDPDFPHLESVGIDINDNHELDDLPF